MHHTPKGGMVTGWRLGSRTTTAARTSISVRSTRPCVRAPLTRERAADQREIDREMRDSVDQGYDGQSG